MTAADYHALKVGDVVLLRAKVTKLYKTGTLGNSAGMFNALLVASGLTGEQRVIGLAQFSEVETK